MSSSQLFTGFYYALWIGQPLLQLSAAWMLRRRKLTREFSFFFQYLLLQGCANVLLLALLTHYRPYFYTYWMVSLVSTVLEFGIIYQVFGQLLRPYPHLREFMSVVLRWVGSLLVVVAILFAISASANEPAIIVAVLWAERSVRLVECGLVFFLLWFFPYLGITRRHYLFGIALGFGTIASTELAAVAARMATGYIGDRGFNLALLTAADFAAIVWLIYLRAPSVARKPVVESASPGQKWEQGVANLLYPQAEPGLLSRIDKLVEDAFVQSRQRELKSPDGPPALHPPPAGHS